MCGIWACIGRPIQNGETCVSKLRNRGPESQRFLTKHRIQLGFARLAINGLSEAGMQPMRFNDTMWICNGEIYNYKSLAQRHSITLTGQSDCEILGPLFSKQSDVTSFFRSLDGVFATVMIDVKQNIAIVGRDPYGIRPLFMAISTSRIVFSSELKGLPNEKFGIVAAFPPGHYSVINLETLKYTLVKYTVLPFVKNPEYSDEERMFTAIRLALTAAVKKRMMTERPVSALLSGGLDSSLICALVQSELKKNDLPPLQTFSIGFEGSEDLKHARQVATHIGSKHTEIIMTPDEFFDSIPAVIRDIESFDITTVRASVGNWLIAREILHRTNSKVVFNGDGSDELFGGYLYFHKCPSDEEFDVETERLLDNIHYFDVLRSDRCISSHGLEPRTPFLDKELVALVRTIPVKHLRPTKTKPEKWALRSAFENTNLLPSEILWRKKEAFSDGVSSSGKLAWFQECLIRSTNKLGTSKRTLYSYLPPTTDEAYYYRRLFESNYSNYATTVIPYFWMPKWSPETNDPSARTLKTDI